MPAPILTESGPPVTDADIDAVEDALGARLPASYRRFLLEHNGGRPEPWACARRQTVHTFYGIHANLEINDLLANRRDMHERLPAQVLPIACGDFGDVFCLALKGKNRGKVYFWDHEGGTPRDDIRAEFPEINWKPYGDGEPRPPVQDDWPGHPDLTLIAESFDEFLDSFHDVDDEAVIAEAESEPEGPTQ